MATKTKTRSSSKSSKADKSSKGGGKSTGKASKNIASKLASFTKNWDKSKKEAKSSQWDYPGPDGQVVGKIESVEFDDNAWGRGEFGVRIRAVCSKGKYKGKPLPSITRSLENEEAMVWLQRDLAKLGVEIDEIDVEALPEIVEDLGGTYFLGKVKTSDQGYQNLNLSKVLDKDDLDDYGDEDDAEEGDEDESEEESEDEDSDEEESEDEDEGDGDEDSDEESEEESEDEDSDEEESEDEDEGDGDGDDEEEGELEVGSKVAWKNGKNELTGVVKKINAKKGIITILPKGKKETVEVKLDKLELLA